MAAICGNSKVEVISERLGKISQVNSSIIIASILYSNSSSSWTMANGKAVRNVLSAVYDHIGQCQEQQPVRLLTSIEQLATEQAVHFSPFDRWNAPLA